MFLFPQKVEKNNPKKLHTYGSPTSQNSPQLHFHFINYFIQLSLLRSLVRAKVLVKIRNHNILRAAMTSPDCLKWPETPKPRQG